MRRFRGATPGSARLSRRLFSVGKYAIGVYLRESALASSFGAAGSLVALLLWVCYSAQIFFLGAQFTRQYALAFGYVRQRTEFVRRDFDFTSMVYGDPLLPKSALARR